MAAEPENPIEAALVRARTDPLARPVFYHLLMSEPLFACGEVERPAGAIAASGNLKLSVVRHNGRSFHPIFTTRARLDHFAGRQTTPHFAIVGRALFECAVDADFVLNPNTDCGKELRAREIAFWLNPSAQARRALAKNPPLAQLSEPSVYPGKLIDAFRILFANRSDVVAAHLLYVAFSDRAEPAHPLIGIQTVGDWAKIAGEVSELAAAIMPEIIIDLVPLGGRETDEGLAASLRKVAPFYERGAGVQ